MFHDLVRWLDDYLHTNAPSAGLRSAAGSLPDLPTSRQERDYYLQRLDWYYGILSQASLEPLVTVESWEQRVEVAPNGDVHEVLKLQAVAGSEWFFARLTANSRWSQPQRQLSKTRMVVRGVEADGTMGRRWRGFSSWEGDKLVSYLDPGAPVTRGQALRFQVDRMWPGKCHPLMRQRREESFSLRTTRALDIKNAEYSVVLPAGFDARAELIGATNPQAHLSQDFVERGGRREYTWRADKVPTGISVGLTLQLN
jgi:hypothetical protein